MMGGEINITFGAAFAAGVFSFFSPCILPLLPVYVSQLSVAVSNRGRGGFSPDWGVFLQALIFVSGFTLVFVCLGTATGMIGRFLAMNREILLRAGGVFVVLMGLNLSGFLRVNIFARQWSPLLGFQPRGILGSFFLGMAFALGWTPCIGPVLASILTLAATTGSAAAGSLLLAFYSLGLAVPFLFLCFTFDRIPGIRNILQKYSRLSLVVSGILLVILGMLMFFNKLQVLAAYLMF